MMKITRPRHISREFNRILRGSNSTSFGEGIPSGVSLSHCSSIQAPLAEATRRCSSLQLALQSLTKARLTVDAGACDEDSDLSNGFSTNETASVVRATHVPLGTWRSARCCLLLMPGSRAMRKLTHYLIAAMRDHFAQASPSAKLPAAMRFWTFQWARSMAATLPLVLQET
jgi:hypothetical protein